MALHCRLPHLGAVVSPGLVGCSVLNTVPNATDQLLVIFHESYAHCLQHQCSSVQLSCYFILSEIRNNLKF